MTLLCVGGPLHGERRELEGTYLVTVELVPVAGIVGRDVPPENEERIYRRWRPWVVGPLPPREEQINWLNDPFGAMRQQGRRRHAEALLDSRYTHHPDLQLAAMYADALYRRLQAVDPAATWTATSAAR